MKPYNYEGNRNGFFAQYHRMKEGPNYFLIYYKHSCVLRQDPKDAWRVLGSAKFTAYSQIFKEWCIGMDEKYGNTSDIEQEGRKDTSFASEALIDDLEVEPNDNTKMVV